VVMYQQLLDQHVSWRQANGLGVQAPATAEQIESVFRRAREELGCDLPTEYADFLKRMNGLSSNGLVFYASELTAIAGHTDRFIEGLVEANLAWREDAGHASLVFFGEGDISRYVLNCENSHYQVLDYQTDTLIEEVTGFDQLLFSALRDHRP
jgi:hypothetical protein